MTWWFFHQCFGGYQSYRVIFLFLGTWTLLHSRFSICLSRWREKKVLLIVCVTLQVTAIHVKQSMVFNISLTVVIPPSLPLLTDGDEKFWSVVETSLWEAVGVKWVGGGWRHKRGGDMSSRTAQKQCRGGEGGGIVGILSYLSTWHAPSTGMPRRREVHIVGFDHQVLLQVRRKPSVWSGSSWKNTRWSSPMMHSKAGDNALKSKCSCLDDGRCRTAVGRLLFFVWNPNECLINKTTITYAEVKTACSLKSKHRQ